MNPIDIRHALHRIPELAFHEHETQAFIRNLLDEWKVLVRPIADTGLLATWNRGGNAPYRLFRADMDALPLQEATGAPFSSIYPDRMHACGHDVHMAVLLGVIRRVVDSGISGNLLFLFQPSEEAGGGAERTIPDLRNYDIAEAWAMHVTDEYPLGMVVSCPGLLFASCLELDCRFRGKSAHAAFHEQGRDAIPGCSELLDSVYRRNWDGDIVRFGRISGGRVRNVVADECTLFGTIRTKSRDRCQSVTDEIVETAKEIAGRRQLNFEHVIGARYPEVRVNQSLFTAFEKIVPVTRCEMKYTGEDFGFFSLRWPSLMFWFGTRLPDQPANGLHHPGFLPPDEAVNNAIDVFWKIMTAETHI
ncbi:MAG: amidohydrolase [Candidatus Riflebacteria bacterium]|nr:amidohydrolase [Candidatus Riflebacteria bacterium]